MHYTGHHIHTIFDNNVLYLWHYMHYIHYITHIIDDNSSTPYDVTFTICGTSHNDSIYDIKPYMFRTYSLYMASHTVLWPYTIVCLHSHYAWYYTQSIFDVTLNEPILWQEVNVSDHSLYMYDTICTTYDITSTLYDINMWHPTHYIYVILSTMYDNTSLCVVDTTLSICVTSFSLQMISHTLYHTKPQYLWCHIHFGHGITTTVSDIAPIVSLSSQPLHWYHSHFCMTSYPLLYDIIPTKYVTSYALYITSYQLLMSSHFCTYDITASTYETTSNM